MAWSQKKSDEDTAEDGPQKGLQPKTISPKDPNGDPFGRPPFYLVNITIFPTCSFIDLYGIFFGLISRKIFRNSQRRCSKLGQRALEKIYTSLGFEPQIDLQKKKSNYFRWSAESSLFFEGPIFHLLKWWTFITEREKRIPNQTSISRLKTKSPSVLRWLDAQVGCANVSGYRCDPSAHVQVLRVGLNRRIYQ